VTKLLEKAIAQARALPPEDQDTLAAILLAMTDEGAGIVPLDDEARAAIREGLEQARRGDFGPDIEIEACWQRILAVFEMPPKPSAEVRDRLNRKPPWEA
jgi:predicted transcriptional regulator